MKYFIPLLLLLSFQSVGQESKWFHFPDSTTDQSTRYIYIDSHDVKWIGGYWEGLQKYSNGTWTYYRSGTVADNDVRQSCFDTNNSLWVATYNGLSRFDTMTGTWTTFNVTGQPMDYLNSVQVDNQGRVWVGTDGGGDPADGLYMYNGSAWKFFSPLNSPLRGRWIKSLEKDRNGQLWGGTRDLFSIDDTVVVSWPVTNPGWNANSYALSLSIDQSNNKWVGFYEGGIGKFDGTSWTIYTTANSPLPEDKIWSIAVDLDDNVWIGTETKGLVRFDGVNWTVFNTLNSPLTNDRIDALAVDKSGNLWIAPFASGIFVYNEDGVSGLKGQLYLDKNSDGIKNEGEPPLANQLVSISPGGYYAITDSSGHYFTSILSAGNFTVKPTISLPYFLNSHPGDTSLNFGDAPSYYNKVDFGIRLQPDTRDNAIDMTSLQAARPGFPFTYHLSARNLGSLRSDSVIIKLNYDSRLSLDSVSIPYLSHSNHSIVWKMDSLDILKQESIYAYFRLSTTAALSSEMVSQGEILDKYSDVNRQNNLYEVADTIRGSFDPNDKNVQPKGNGPSGIIPPATAELTYTIRFQNTGTDTAFNVVVRDTLSSLFNMASLEIISASHKYIPEIKNGRNLAFHFNDILLPDSNRNEPASHGYIKYRIKLNQGLSIGTEIRNKASIYFDYNAPVVTNETLNTLQVVTSVTDPVVESANSIFVYPNPSREAILIKSLLRYGGRYDLFVTDVAGKVVLKKEKISQGEYWLPVSSLSPGLYFISVQSGNHTATSQFVKY